jgi:hypothetical protein
MREFDDPRRSEDVRLSENDDTDSGNRRNESVLSKSSVSSSS